MKLKSKFPPPSKADTENIVSRSYWRWARETLGKPKYQRAVAQFLEALQSKRRSNV